jgi:hypothetical protein
MGVSYPNQAVATRFHSNNFSRNGNIGGRFAGGNRLNGGQSFGGSRFNSNSGAALSNRGSAGVAGNESGWRHFSGGGGAATNGYAGAYRRQGSSNYAAGTPAQSYRGNYSAAPQYRTAPANNRSYAAPRAPQSYAAPRSYAAMPRQSFQAPRGQSFSAPRAQAFAAPRSSGGFSGARSSGFSGGSTGGHAGGGGHHR